MSPELSIPAGWSLVPFEEAIDFKEGPGILAKDFRPSGIPLIRLAGLDQGARVLDGCDYLDPDTVSRRWEHFRVSKGDVLLSTSASLGRIAVVDDASVGAVPYTGIIRMRPRSSRLQAAFIPFLLESPHFQAQVEAMGVGSVMRHFGPSHLRHMQVLVPDPPTQRAITHILRALDDKIDLNRRMNETIEGIARALFKSWFVDFDPTRAKAAGRRPFGLNTEVAQAFPSKFQHAEGDEIPSGWETTSVYDLATFINGAAYRAFEPNEDKKGLPIIKIAELKTGVTAQTRFSDVPMAEKYRLRQGDILFSWSGNPDTSIDTFVWCHGPAWLNQHIFRVVPHTSSERSFVFASLKYLRPVFAEIARNKQTTGLGHVTVEDLKRLRVVRPSDDALRCWGRIADPLLERAFDNAVENLTLAAIRKALFPRLLSGEIRIPEHARGSRGNQHD